MKLLYITEKKNPIIEFIPFHYSAFCKLWISIQDFKDVNAQKKLLPRD